MQVCLREGTHLWWWPPLTEALAFAIDPDRVCAVKCGGRGSVSVHHYLWYASKLVHWCSVYKLPSNDIPTNIAPAAHQRASGGQLPLSHWVALRWVARWASRGPPEASLLLSLLLYPLTLLCTSWFSASLILAFNRQIGATALPPPVAQSRLLA